MDNSPLARLSLELRELIYDFALLPFPDNEIRIETIQHSSAGTLSSDNVPKSLHLSLLQVCRQVHQEAIRRFYGQNVFMIPPTIEGTPCYERLATFISTIGNKNAADLREIHLTSTLSPGMFGNGKFRRSLKSVKETAECIPRCAVKILLTFLDVYKSIAIRVQLDLRVKPNEPGDGWIEVCEPIAASTENANEVRDSINFLRGHLRECKQDLEAA